MSLAPETPPAVSLIVVNYNAGPLLADCVRAALASEIPVEILVSDNGSSDQSLDRLRQETAGDPRLTILENGANLGFAKANNRALPLTRAPRLLFLNPDCLMRPDTLSRLLAVMDERPDAGMLGCLVLDPDGTEQVACRRSIPDPWMALRRLLGLDRFIGSGAGRRLDRRGEPLPTEPVEVEAISGSFMLVSRQALDAVGPLDEGYFLHCEDLDWFVRFRQAGWKIVLVPDASVIHYKGACSRRQPLSVERHKHRGMARFFRKHQSQGYPRPFVALVVLGIWLHFGLKATWIGWRGLSARLGPKLAR